MGRVAPTSSHYWRLTVNASIATIREISNSARLSATKDCDRVGEEETAAISEIGTDSHDFRDTGRADIMTQNTGKQNVTKRRKFDKASVHGGRQDCITAIFFHSSVLYGRRLTSKPKILFDPEDTFRPADLTVIYRREWKAERGKSSGCNGRNVEEIDTPPKRAVAKEEKYIRHRSVSPSCFPFSFPDIDANYVDCGIIGQYNWW